MSEDVAQARHDILVVEDDDFITRMFAVELHPASTASPQLPMPSAWRRP
jgi:hypothetical protein